MTAASPSLDIDWGTFAPSDPWSEDWVAPTNAELDGRHESARRHQQEGWFPSQGITRPRVDPQIAPERFVIAGARDDPDS